MSTSSVFVMERCGCVVDRGIPYRCVTHSLRGDRCPWGPLQLHTWRGAESYRVCEHCGSTDSSGSDES